jgi:hypothetical protein
VSQFSEKQVADLVRQRPAEQFAAIDACAMRDGLDAIVIDSCHLTRAGRGIEHGNA